MPAREYFNGLSDEDAAKVAALFKRLAETGEIKNTQQFKKLGNVGGHRIWEFKRYQQRFLGRFTPGRQFVVAHGLQKKRDGHKKRDLERAARVLTKHLARQDMGGSR